MEQFTDPLGFSLEWLQMKLGISTLQAVPSAVTGCAAASAGCRPGPGPGSAESASPSSSKAAASRFGAAESPQDELLVWAVVRRRSASAGVSRWSWSGLSSTSRVSGPNLWLFHAENGGKHQGSFVCFGLVETYAQRLKSVGCVFNWVCSCHRFMSKRTSLFPDIQRYPTIRSCTPTWRCSHHGSWRSSATPCRTSPRRWRRLAPSCCGARWT